jgi:hypothetical protein
LVLGAGFEPAVNLPCKRSGFDHSHHPSKLETPKGLEPSFSIYGPLVRNQNRYGVKLEVPVRLELTSSTYGYMFRKHGRYGTKMVTQARFELASSNYGY